MSMYWQTIRLNPPANSVNFASSSMRELCRQTSAPGQPTCSLSIRSFLPHLMPWGGFKHTASTRIRIKLMARQNTLPLTTCLAQTGKAFMATFLLHPQTSCSSNCYRDKRDIIHWRCDVKRTTFDGCPSCQSERPRINQHHRSRGANLFDFSSP